MRDLLDRSDSEVAFALACFGGGSMIAAVSLPRVLERTSGRAVMLPAAGLLALLLLAYAGPIGMASHAQWPALTDDLGTASAIRRSWFRPGGCCGARRMATTGQPCSPHSFRCRMPVSYLPLAGWLGLKAGIPATLFVLSILTLIGLVAALLVWPAVDPDIIAHRHEDLPPDHPHLKDQHGGAHAHALAIDDLHPRWPTARA